MHFVVHQLQHVFVAGHHIDRVRFRSRFPGQGADYVVGFVTFELQYRNAISFERASNIRNLLHQVARHLGAVRLVAAIL